MLDDGFDPLIWPSALLLNAVALPAGNWVEVWGYILRSVEGNVNNRITPVEASSDWRISVCFSIKSLVGESYSGLDYLYSLSKKNKYKYVIDLLSHLLVVTEYVFE